MMKRILFTFLITIGSISLYAQAPENFNFFTVIFNGSGKPIVSRAVSFKFNILKGNPLGISVYEEKYNVTTDLSGAVKAEVGNGFDKIGVFETIDWGVDSYFLKVGLDTTGGTSYINMGVTQLSSVPYALYAKTAANGFSGNYNDLTNKPVTDGSETIISAGNFLTISGSGTTGNPYIISNMFGGDYNELTNKPVTNGSETKIKVGNNLTITGSGTTDDPYSLNTNIHYVGESYGGGIVFYVYDNGRHGLIAATTDQNPGIEWYNGTKRYTNTTGDGVGAGEMNTTLIIALQTNDNQTGNFAAKACADYSVAADGITFGDWYLPSKYELSCLFLQKDKVGGFNNDYYWSSTEFSSISAWSQNFSNGIQYNLSKSIPYGVRAIRAF